MCRDGYVDGYNTDVRDVECFDGVEADRVLHVGDSFETDVRGAYRAGMRMCWVKPEGVESPPASEENDAIMKTCVVVRDVAELATLLE